MSSSDERGLTIRYVGGEADRHAIGMRELATSMNGFERLIAIGLYVLENGRAPKRGEALPLKVQASEPRRGSFELAVLLADSGVEVVSFLKDVSMAVLEATVVGILLKCAGRSKESDEALRASLKNHEHRLRNLEAMPWETMRRHAKDAIKPMGVSCDTIIINGDGNSVNIDRAIGEAIRRPKERATVGEAAKFLVRVDGFTHHNSQVKISLHNEPERIIVGHVHDPSFQDIPNIYTDTASRKGLLNVLAKPTFTATGVIKKLHILEAVEPGQSDWRD